MKTLVPERAVYAHLRYIATAGFFLACLSLAQVAAAATTVEGCDPKVEQTHQAKAQAMVDVDVNGTESTFQKPDSTAAMTCFNVLAGNDAADSGNTAYGGHIFSGDFSGVAGYKSTIEDALTNFYGDFTDANGNDSGMVAYTGATTLSPNAGAPCGQIEDSTGAASGLWTRVKQQGIAQGAPSVTSVTDLLSGTPPDGQNPNGVNNWQNEATTDSDFNQYATARGNETPPMMQTIGPADSLCQTLIDANIPGAGCQNGE